MGGANNMDWVNFLGLVDIYSFCHVACRCRMWVWQLLVLGQMWGTLCQWLRKAWPRKAWPRGQATVKWHLQECTHQQ